MCSKMIYNTNLLLLTVTEMNNRIKHYKNRIPKGIPTKGREQTNNTKVRNIQEITDKIFGTCSSMSSAK